MDGVIGIWTLDRKILRADKSSELCWKIILETKGCI